MNKSKRGEFEFTDALKEYARALSVDVELTDDWLSIGYPWDLISADNRIRNGESHVGRKCRIDGKVENSFIDDNVIIEPEAVVKDSIVYKNSIIKKESIVLDSVIGENVSFDGKIESKENARSLVRNNWVTADKLGAIIADNVIADKVDIKAGVKIWPNKRIEGKIESDVD